MPGRPSLVPRQSPRRPKRRRSMAGAIAGRSGGCAGRLWDGGRLGCACGRGPGHSARSGDRVERGGGRRARRASRQLGFSSGRRGRLPGEVGACGPELQEDPRNGLERVSHRQRVDDLRAVARRVLQGAGSGPLQRPQQQVEPEVVTGTAAEATTAGAPSRRPTSEVDGSVRDQPADEQRTRTARTRPRWCGRRR